MADQPKAIVSTGVFSVLKWHIWTFLSLSGTLVLICLNFRQVFLGAELGGTSKSSADIIGFLQIVAKLHELSIIASLVTITEQYILRDLLGDGLLLGLLGAAGTIVNPSFLISTRFKLAFKFGLQSIYSPLDNRDHVRTLQLVIMILLSCVIAGLAGPSSAVLMIPRVGWFERATNHHRPLPRSTIPTILIGTAPGMVGEVATMESNPFTLPYYLVNPGFQYWADVSSGELLGRDWNPEAKTAHLFHDYFGMRYMQTSELDYRALDDGWPGGTWIKTEARFIFALDSTDNWWMETEEVTGDWAKLKLVYKTQVINAFTTCRSQRKMPCTTDSTISPDSPYPDWCYRTVHADPTTVGELRMGRNLLMSRDFIVGQPYPRVWLTEGPRIEENQYYSDSIEVLLENNPAGRESMMPNLTVCSFSAVLLAATATELGTEYVSRSLEFHNFVFNSNGTTSPPRKFLFHENWLDRAYGFDPSIWLSDSILNPIDLNTTAHTDGTGYDGFNYSIPTGSMVYPDNFTYPGRPGLFPQMNTFGRFGASIGGAVGFLDRDSDGVDTDSAFVAEATVGGLLTYIISWSLPSFSQYSMPYDQIPEKFRLNPPISFQYPFVERIYVNGYGYRLSSRTGYLGVSVLLLHAVFAITALLHHGKKSIIHAWSTVPDYFCLGSGSSSVAVKYPNTCAGIAGEQGLCSMVKVVETGKVLSAPHLKVVSVDDSGKVETAPGLKIVSVHDSGKAETVPVLEVASVHGSGEAGKAAHLEVVLVHGSEMVETFPVDLGDDERLYGVTEPKPKTE
ncbi:hypothetical protein Q9L58_008111 [Maublancomyces gigas]|uniref:Uncharacterized protein n=1 Tax=Discina gigas TaxID=1032678 RepID=A0ABR3GAR4_9PEZI